MDLVIAQVNSEKGRAESPAAWPGSHVEDSEFEAFVCGWSGIYKYSKDSLPIIRKPELVTIDGGKAALPGQWAGFAGRLGYSMRLRGNMEFNMAQQPERVDHKREVAPQDAELLRLIQCGDTEAWGTFVTRYAGITYSLIQKIVKRCDEAEDAVQETFLSVRRSAGTFQSGKIARNWVLKIAARQAIKKLNARKKQAERYVEEDLCIEDSEQDFLCSGDLKTALGMALDDLPAPLRQVIALKFGAGLSQQEIAIMLECNQTTVSYRLRQGLGKLEAQLRKVAGFEKGAYAPSMLVAAVLHGVVPDELTTAIIEAPFSAGSGASDSTRVSRIDGSRSIIWTGIAVSIVVAGSMFYGLKLSNNDGGMGASSNPGIFPLPYLDEPLNESSKETVRSRGEKSGLIGSWDFTKKPSDELGEITGRWTWLERQPGSGVMLSPIAKGVIVRIPRTLDAQPIHVRAWGFLRKSGANGGVDVLITNEKGLVVVQRAFMRRMRVSPTARICFEAYIFSRYIVQTVSGKVTRIVEYPSDYPGNGICLDILNMAISRIELNYIRSDERPPSVCAPQELIKKSGEFAQYRSMTVTPIKNDASGAAMNSRKQSK